VEVAKLAHVAPVVSVAWMEGDIGVVSLGETGEVSKWTRVVRIFSLDSPNFDTNPALGRKPVALGETARCEQRASAGDGTHFVRVHAGSDSYRVP